MTFTLSELNALYVATGRYAKETKADFKKYKGEYFQDLINQAEALHDKVGKELGRRAFELENEIDNING